MEAQEIINRNLLFFSFLEFEQFDSEEKHIGIFGKSGKPLFTTDLIQPYSDWPLLIEALEKIAMLDNEDHYHFSIGKYATSIWDMKEEVPEDALHIAKWIGFSEERSVVHSAWEAVTSFLIDYKNENTSAASTVQ